MTVLSAATAAAVVTAYDFSQLRLVIDVGGGQGRLIAAILRANPAVRGVLLDLPSVVDAAGRLLAEASVAERCEVMGGDMFTAVPEGGDLYILSRVINSFEDDRALAVLANCRKAIGERGRLLIVEPVLPDPVEVTAPASVQADLLMDLNMLVRTGGRERTGPEYHAFLAAAGLRLERLIPTGGSVSLIEAVPA
jgi:SAM-dependent methyltransferase